MEPKASSDGGDDDGFGRRYYPEQDTQVRRVRSFHDIYNKGVGK